MRRALFCLLCATGCATAGEHTTWEDDAREGVGTSVPRTPHPSIVGVFIPASFDEKSPAEERGAGVDPQAVELAILRFTTKRRQLAQEFPREKDRSWPRPIQAAFSNILDELERAMGAPKGSLPRRVLIQSRVTLEVEMENSESKYGVPPSELSGRIQKLFGSIALHMRATPPAENDRRGRALDDAIALMWPVQPVIVTSQFGYRRDPILGRENVRFHAGVDLGGDSGDVVHASGPGRVVGAGWTGGHGRSVVVQHPGGVQTMYAHLRQIIVSIGMEVEAGSPIGLMGSSGRSTGPHLHFEVRRGGVPLDPLEVLGPTFAEHGEKRSDHASARN